MSRKKKAGIKKTEEEKGKITRELAPLQPWKRNKERMKGLCDDLLRKYPGRDFTKLPRVELAELIAVVQREFDNEGWDSKNAESAIKLVVEGAKVARQRKSSRKGKRAAERAAKSDTKHAAERAARRSSRKASDKEVAEEIDEMPSGSAEKDNLPAKDNLV